MVLDARERLRAKHPKIAQRITPQLLSVYFRYIRNLSLMDRRLTPDLYTLIIAAQQTAGDDFALALAETAREYPFAGLDESTPGELRRSRLLRMGINQAEVPVWGIGPMVSRLPGQSLTWRTCELRPRPHREEQKRWRQSWDPSACARGRPRTNGSRASIAMSANRRRRSSAPTWPAPRSSRPASATASTSAKPCGTGTPGTCTSRSCRRAGARSRWSSSSSTCPPTPGLHQPHNLVRRTRRGVDTGLLRDRPMKNLVGPGIAQAEYGGALFIFPPRPIPDVWTDPRLDFTDTLEERLLAAAFLHSRDRHVAVVSPKLPPASWRRLARRFGRKIVHLPLKRFSGQLIERLRTFHVLNGKRVRSYAADFIRDM